jgi:pyruvyl transferase EpsO
MFKLKRPFYYQLAKERLLRGETLLSSGKVVVTDRLHAHILCTLLDIPHVVLDNSYRKIGNFRDAWGTGGDKCLTANTLEDAMKLARGLLNS